MLTDAAVRTNTHPSPAELPALGGITVGMLICYDRQPPEAARTLAVNGAELLLIVWVHPLPKLQPNSMQMAHSV